MHNQTKYAVSWSANVVHTFVDEWPRAAEIVMRISGITEIQLALSLARGEPSWEKFKKLVKCANGALLGSILKKPDERIRLITDAVVSCAQMLGLKGNRELLTNADFRAIL